jgi:hypothetical protein
MIALEGDDWTFAAVVSSQGDKTLAPQLTTHVCRNTVEMVKQLGVPDRGMLEVFLEWMNLWAYSFRIDMGLARDFPLGTAVAALARHKDQADVATVGATGVFSMLERRPNEFALESFYSNHRSLHVPLDRANQVVALQAPLGFLDFGEGGQGKGWADCREVRLVKRDDLVALATFRFPREPGPLTEVGATLVRSAGAATSAQILTNTLTAEREALCGTIRRLSG